MVKVSEEFTAGALLEASPVQTAPPSPVVIVLLPKNENVPISPKVPGCSPSRVLPRHSAQSSTTRKPCRFAISMIAFMSHTPPNKCTGTMALVRGVMSASILDTSISQSSARLSQNTGVAPVCEIVATLAIYVNAGTITSSPGPTPRQCNARCSAAVPLQTEIACSTPRTCASFASNLPTYAPREDTQPDSTQSSTYSRSRPFSSG